MAEQGGGLTMTRIIQQLLNVIGVWEEVEKDTKFARRPRVSDGDREEKRDQRPLLVGLVHKYHSDLILENCWKLADNSNVAMRVVSVVKEIDDEAEDWVEGAVQGGFQKEPCKESGTGLEEEEFG
jgi:hypothetical protein